MRTRTRRPALVVLALVGGLVAAACNGSGQAANTEAPPTTQRRPDTTTTEEPATTQRRPDTTTSEASTTTAAPTTTTELVIERMPLTGAPLEFGQSVPDRPALVVKIDNNPRARPQSGLNAADIVFEEVVEYGTRFAAVFHSGDANPVGPIRSGRTQDIDLLGGLQRPLFAWSGGNPGVTQAIADSDFVDLNPSGVPGGTYGRQGNNGTPHNYYSGTDKLWALTNEEAGRPVPLFGYLDPGVLPSGDPGGRADVRMDTDSVLWEYDPASGAYWRSTNGQTHEDGNSGDQVNAANVVIMETPYRPSYVDSNSPEAVTIGGGPVWVLSGGTVRTGSWMRGSREEGIGLYAADGSVIELLPGRTWVELADPVDGAPVIS